MLNKSIFVEDAGPQTTSPPSVPVPSTSVSDLRTPFPNGASIASSRVTCEVSGRATSDRQLAGRVERDRQWNAPHSVLVSDLNVRDKSPVLRPLRTSQKAYQPMACAASEESSPSPAPTESSTTAKTIKPKEVILGVCGGVGPAAGLLLHQLILDNTDSAGKDQGHLNVSHFSRPEDMTDRTEFLRYYTATLSADATDSDSDSRSSSSEGPCGSATRTLKPVENPACGMARTFAMMHAAAIAGNARLVVGVPCNTFHAQPIWDEFMRRTASADDVCHVHMLEETVAFIARKLPTCTRVGLLSTTGTRKLRVYHDLLEPRGYTVVEVRAGAMQDELHASIYNRDWGVKSTAPAVSPQSEANFHRYAEHLVEQGAEVIILGCTEIPFVFAEKTDFAGVLLIDPMVALARAMIREADPSRLKHTKDTTSPKEVSSIWPIVPLNIPIGSQSSLALKYTNSANDSVTLLPPRRSKRL